MRTCLFAYARARVPGTLVLFIIIIGKYKTIENEATLYEPIFTTKQCMQAILVFSSNWYGIVNLYYSRLELS